MATRLLQKMMDAFDDGVKLEWRRGRNRRNRRIYITESIEKNVCEPQICFWARYEMATQMERINDLMIIIYRQRKGDMVAIFHVLLLSSTNCMSKESFLCKMASVFENNIQNALISID